MSLTKQRMSPRDPMIIYRNDRVERWSYDSQYRFLIQFPVQILNYKHVLLLSFVGATMVSGGSWSRLWIGSRKIGFRLSSWYHCSFRNKQCLLRMDFETACPPEWITWEDGSARMTFKVISKTRRPTPQDLISIYRNERGRHPVPQAPHHGALVSRDWRGDCLVGRHLRRINFRTIKRSAKRCWLSTVQVLTGMYGIYSIKCLTINVLGSRVSNVSTALDMHVHRANQPAASYFLSVIFFKKLFSFC